MNTKSYKYGTSIYNTKAAAEVVPILLSAIKVKSILDVGCGTATWLKVFQQHGIDEILGIDNSDLKAPELEIDEKYFIKLNLNKEFQLNMKFDLILCLEVAEHLPESSADGLVTSLCAHGNTVAFSAAIPGQGGQGHINEQWPSYWISKFAEKNFQVFDLLRERVWSNKNVEWWYRQNIVLFGNEESPLFQLYQPTKNYNCYIHPELFTSVSNQRDYYLKKMKPTAVKSFLHIFKRIWNKISHS